MNIDDLIDTLKTAHRVCDEEWNKIGPERRKHICDNIMKRAMRRIKEKEEEKHET